MARKVHTHKRHDEGLHNSQHNLKLQEEASQMHHSEAKSHYSTKGSKNNGYSNVTSVREMMTDEKLSKQSCNRNMAPSIVARLMGLDMMPLQDKRITDQNMEEKKIFEKRISRSGSVDRSSSNSSSSRKTDIDSFYQDIDDDGLGKELTNPMLLRPHPQEEELKKFKGEFEAYQASRLKEYPKFNERRTKSVQEMVPCNASFKTKTKRKGKVAEKGAFPSTMKNSRSRFDGNSLSTSQITVLKPCFYHGEESLKTSTSIEDFLEQVKVKLLSEIQGRKSTFEKCSSVRGSENERHRSSEVTNLLHSQSARSYRSEIEFKGQSSPESISRGTRRSERLRNFVNSENLNDDALLQKELSPMMILERSFSAPLSGKYCRIPIRDHVWEKLEDLERMLPFDAKKKKNNKDRFGIKEKVSNLKQKFGLRGKIFAKRIHSMVETPNSIEDGFMVRDIRSGPTVLMKHGRSHDNFTEVPPSPESLCSSVHEELWWQSPFSTPGESSSVDDSIMPQVYGYITSDLNELSKQLSQLEFDSPEELETKPKSSEYELDRLLDPAESYIRDLLVASGLYFESWDKYLLREDTLTNPIDNSIFEEVEESHKNKCLVNENIDNKLDHKILLDLLNEALSIVLGQPLTMSRFRRKLNNNNSCVIQKTPPCGKELLKLVWDIIHVSLYPPKISNTCSCSFISLVKQDFGSILLYGLMNDEINVLEMEMARLISDDLVEELIKDMIDNFKCKW
ncbi:hypothetical protein PIB30_005453 [Stylosanthes scabra]|uniref:DUF3741 domain-containing protein n=1 Tax=Stylosanthes scabra TaxID=79078 RepID=A0ABU6Y174_9FABA|nr:hypothetical protein [Stylosanthes scabra]